MTYIIIGIILATIGLPLLTSVAEFIEVIFEYLKCKFALKIAEFNMKIGDLAQPQQDESTQAIGFTIQNKEDDNDNE